MNLSECESFSLMITFPPIDTQNVPGQPKWVEDNEMTRKVAELGYDHVMDMVISEMTNGVKPDTLAKRLKVPFHLFLFWFHRDQTRMALYHKAQEMWAEKLHSEIVEIADKAETPEEVQAAKLRIDSRLKVAKSYNRGRFGDIVKVDQTVNHTVSIKGLLAEREAKLLQRDVIEGECKSLPTEIPEISNTVEVDDVVLVDGDRVSPVDSSS